MSTSLLAGNNSILLVSNFGKSTDLPAGKSAESVSDTGDTAIT
jgi:hypothetical protein